VPVPVFRSGWRWSVAKGDRHRRSAPFCRATVNVATEPVPFRNSLLSAVVLTIVVSDPLDYDTFDKLRLILNRQIEIALASREAILDPINRLYSH
jgi:type IV pilus assembly protein PilB